MEDIIQVKEVILEVDRSPEHRAELSRAKAELKRYLKLKEEFWMQKSGMRWFSQGDKNTKLFHSYVQCRRKKLQVNEIVDE